ncbi:hypothetical protein HZH68_011270 [Vespula germanica]|uniref:Uncharacterized protein n=1 Tax=Vespula germanica TaxID=30212 RepID=A0A834N0A9_VESGE|nr:hypothetical protein HZH68_011270 [Vespula germanica]
MYFLNEQQPEKRVVRITEEDIKENKEPETVSPGCSQAISKKTTVADTPDTMLNKINSILDFVLQKSEDSFLKEEGNAE